MINTHACITFLFVFYISNLFGQNISGTIINNQSNNPVEYANIGIAGKNLGTVTDQNGRFTLYIDSTYNNDSVLISSIGYNSAQFKIADLRNQQNTVLHLSEKAYQIAEVLVKPKIFKQQTLGVTTKNKRVLAGFKDNLLGYECGIMMKVKKSAFIKQVNINILHCSYDTIFYRLNIYKVNDKSEFENILKEPIYLKMPKELVKDEIHIDLQSKNIVVDGYFLVTLEHVKNLGEGYLYFCASIGTKSYYRKTSQANWDSVLVGVSISVIADVEK